MNLHNSKLWEELQAAGYNLNPRNTQEPKNEQFRRIAELSAILSAGSRAPLKSSSSSSGNPPARGSLIPELSAVQRENLRLPDDTSEEEPESSNEPEPVELQNQQEVDDSWDNWGGWKASNDPLHSAKPSSWNDRDQSDNSLTPQEEALHKFFQLKYARGRLTIRPANERVIPSLPSRDLDEWLSYSLWSLIPNPAEKDAEFEHLKLIRELAAKYLPDPDHKGRTFSQLYTLEAYPDQQGAWSSSYSRSKYPWTQDNFQPFPPSPAKGKGKNKNRNQPRGDQQAPWRQRESKKSAPRSPKPSRPAEPSGAPAFPGKDRKAFEEKPGPRPPGFDSLLGDYNSLLNYGLTPREHSNLIRDICELQRYLSQDWEYLNYTHPRTFRAKLCPRSPDFTRRRRLPDQWSSESKAKLKPAFCVYIRIPEEGKIHGDGASIGARGHPSDPGLNAACAALHSFQKLTSEQQGIEPPPELLVHIRDSSALRDWAKTYVRVIFVENKIRKHRAQVIKSSNNNEAWIDGTRDRYKNTHLRRFFQALLQKRDLPTGFAPIPSEDEARNLLQGLSLQPIHELEPELAINRPGAPPKKGFRDESDSSVLNGLAAKALATATAVDSATHIIHELLQFTVQGVTQFQSRISPTIVEAAGALLNGGHWDSLHRDFSLSTTLVLCLFFKATGVAASYEARNSGKPYSPKQLAKVFETTLYEIFTDPKGHFKQKPGAYPDESEARRSAAAFIAEVFGEASLLASLPITEPESLCQQFLTSAITAIYRDRSAIQADSTGDRFVQRELHQEGAGEQQPVVEPSSAEGPDLDSLFAPDPDIVTIDPDLRRLSLQNLDKPVSDEEEEEETDLAPATEAPSE